MTIKKENDKTRLQKTSPENDWANPGIVVLDARGHVQQMLDLHFMDIATKVIFQMTSIESHQNRIDVQSNWITKLHLRGINDEIH